MFFFFLGPEGRFFIAPLGTDFSTIFFFSSPTVFFFLYISFCSWFKSGEENYPSFRDFPLLP